MDSLDLLTQPAYQAVNHLQSHHYESGNQQRQQQQVDNADFSSTQFYQNSQVATTTSVDFRLTSSGITSSSSSGSSSPEEQQHQEISNSISKNHQTGHHINHQQQSNKENSNTSREIDHQVAETTTASEGEEANDDDDDDDSFVAFCTDASSVLNNDPTRRYYVNKLYQPMNGQQEDPSSALVEQDDDFLLYQDLRFLESAAQELTDERRRVQLNKILEDDEGDDDQLLAISSFDDDGQSKDDPLDRLQLTTMIEGFDSFPSSPLICHNGRDPLISEASEHHQDQQPDSTRHSGQISPSSNSSSCTNSGQITTNSNSYMESDNHYQQQFDCENQDENHMQQFGLNDHHHHHHHQQQQQHHQNDHDNSQHFLSINSGPHEHRDQQHIQHHNHQHHSSHQINEDFSEISCFQSSICPNFVSNASVPEVTQQPEVFKNCETQQQHQGPTDSSANSNQSSNNSTRSKKRSSHQVDDGNDEASCDETDRSGLRTSVKNRTKKKYNPQTNESTSKGTIASSFEQSSAINTNMTPTNSEYQHQHIIASQVNDHQNSINSDENLDDSNMSLDEDASSSAGGSSRRNSSMSKYRRRTANARERIRMREINQAFEKLKKVVPIELIQQSMSGDESDQTTASSRRGSNKSSNGQNQHNASTDPQSVKLTKITTLRLAVSYIAKLSEVLSNHPECGSQTPAQNSTLANTNEANGSSSSRASKGEPGTEVKAISIPKKRRGRVNSAAKKQAANELSKSRTNKRAGKQQSPVISSTTTTTTLNTIKQQSVPESSARQPATIVSNHQGNNQGQRQPILIANNVINGQIRPHHTTAFVPIQQQQQQQQQQQATQPQFAYTQCNQQPMAITQTSNGQDRTFVTPLAVAILGIQGSNEQTQTLQLVGIQNAQQHLQTQQQQQHQNQHQQHQHQHQPSSQYNLITTNNQQPQQVTLTLDDINGLSVLRLANPQATICHSQQQTIHLQQHGRPTIIHQPRTILATQNGGNQAPIACQQQQQFNYTTYQPIQISQAPQASGQQQVASLQLQEIVNGQNQNGIMQRSSSGFSEQQSASFGSNQQNNSAIASQSANTQTMATNTPAATPNSTTGMTSDCRSFGISPNMLAQHLNSNNSSNVVQTTQIKLQQSNCSGQLVQNGQLVAMPAGAQLFQAPSGSNASAISGQTNLIYINPPISLQSSAVNHQSQQIHQPQHQVQQVQIQRAPLQMQQQQIQLHCSTNNSGSASQLTSPQQRKQDVGLRYETTTESPASFERMKFVTQFSSQNGVQHQENSSKSNSEASIRQLVATLATSIHPKSGNKPGKSNNQSNQCGGDNQQRQQPKKTYRFHNYDGNMITNHLYNNTNNNADKQQQQQQQQTKKYQQPQQQPQADQIQNNNANSQRSRQNSLSSTCSTTSSSSSLVSLSTASPLVGSIVIKSPSLENGNSSSGGGLSAYPSTSASTMQPANETTPEPPVAVVVGSN